MLRKTLDYEFQIIDEGEVSNPLNSKLYLMGQKPLCLITKMKWAKSNSPLVLET